MENLQVLVLVQVFHIASHIVGFAHQLLTARPDERLRSPLSLFSRFADIRHYQSVDAAAVLMPPLMSRIVRASRYSSQISKVGSDDDKLVNAAYRIEIQSLNF